MSTSGKDPDNVLGAIIFFSYILAALGLTGLIFSDLFKAFEAFSKSKANTSHRHSLVLVFATFAVISFSSLSYHMLNVLVHSYTEWADVATVPLPQTFWGALSGQTDAASSFLNIWTWAKSSTLFQDFTKVICNDPVRFWWTQQALLLSIGWNTFMAIEGKSPSYHIICPLMLSVPGTKRDIPRLWAYFLLDQVLPVSFTLNLFCVALLLAPPPTTEKKLYATTPLLQILSLLAYFLSVTQAPANVDTPWLLPTLLATRALLFAPYLVLAPSSRLSWRTPVGQSASRGTLHEAYRPAWKMILVCTVVMYVRQYRVVLDDNHKSAIWEGFRTLNDVPAVSALAYDYILGLGSLYVFWATT
jgi:hypothetical protein